MATLLMNMPTPEHAAMTALESALRDERGALIENNVEVLLRASEAKLGALRVLEANPPSREYAAHLAQLAEMNRENGQLLSRRRRVVDWTLRQLGRQPQHNVYDPQGSLTSAPRARELGVV